MTDIHLKHCVEQIARFTKADEFDKPGRQTQLGLNLGRLMELVTIKTGKNMKKWWTRFEPLIIARDFAGMALLAKKLEKYL